jgi:hypothetical protein
MQICTFIRVTNSLVGQEVFVSFGRKELPLCLIKHHTKTASEGVVQEFLSFMKVSGKFHASDALPPRKETRLPVLYEAGPSTLA